MARMLCLFSCIIRSVECLVQSILGRIEEAFDLAFKSIYDIAALLFRRGMGAALGFVMGLDCHLVHHLGIGDDDGGAESRERQKWR